MRGSRAPSCGDPEHERGIERRRVRRGELGGDDDPGVWGPCTRLRGQRLHHPASDIEHVRRALLQQWLIEPAVAGGDRLGGVVPASLGGGPRADRLIRRSQHRVVNEQCEVRVENVRLGPTGTPGHCLTVVLDRPASGGQPVLEPLALAFWRLSHALRGRIEAAREMAGHADGQPRGCRNAPE